MFYKDGTVLKLMTEPQGVFRLLQASRSSCPHLERLSPDRLTLTSSQRPPPYRASAVGLGSSSAPCYAIRIIQQQSRGDAGKYLNMGEITDTRLISPLNTDSS